ncbi:Mitochondrial carrier protein [Klebsormidium nitens]|uniref:Mitochondrial carrier protein n=1 Tax=Klebsormidium nitens TaxID=105231 RepID=A0A1Y1HJC1_KLENI|nr:Mitochondrial carrier protein [Klebsormidium nitens]|eukprot:GAQ78614.1 Mitochondrial carrier protein [Klebsormidium nitens]
MGQRAELLEDAGPSGATSMQRLLGDARMAGDEMGSGLQAKVLELGDNLRKMSGGISEPVRRKLGEVGKGLDQARRGLLDVRQGLEQRIHLPNIDLGLEERQTPFVQVDVDTDLIPLNKNVQWQNVRLGFASLSTLAVESRPLRLPALPDLGGLLNRLHVPFMDGTALSHVVAATLARTAAQVVGHPIDTVKTRLQVKNPPKKLRKWRKKISKKAVGIGPVDIDNWWFKGPNDLYRGVTIAVLGTLPNAFMYFTTYELAKRQLEKKNLPSDLVHIGSASLGTFAASIVRVPFDTMKHRVQAYMHQNLFDAVRTVVAQEGIRGLYAGFWPTLMRDIPEIAIQFSIYEKMRGILESRREVKKLATHEHLLLGGLAGACAATCTAPLDLVKTRQQCGMGLSIRGAMMSIVDENGVLGLFAGLPPRAIHVTVMSAAFFALFEGCKLLLKPDRHPSDKLVIPKIWRKRRDKIWKRQFVYTD